MPPRAGESLVGCDERGREKLGQGDVRGVVGGEMAAELPHPLKERSAGVSRHSQALEVFQCEKALIGAKSRLQRQPPNERRYLEVDQMGRMDALSGLKPLTHPLPAPPTP
jgi:hypothetical protein